MSGDAEGPTLHLAACVWEITAGVAQRWQVR